MIDGLQPANVIVRMRYKVHIEISFFDWMTRLKKNEKIHIEIIWYYYTYSAGKCSPLSCSTNKKIVQPASLLFVYVLGLFNNVGKFTQIKYAALPYLVVSQKYAKKVVGLVVFNYYEIIIIMICLIYEFSLNVYRYSLYNIIYSKTVILIHEELLILRSWFT